MLTKTAGIVFRKIPYSETSIICDIYTLEHGLMSYIVGGVRKPRARTSASLLELMSIVEILAYHSDKNKLHRIKEIKPAYVYQTIPLDVRKNAVLLFMAELCSRTIKETEQNVSLFDMIRGQLERLDRATDHYANIHLEFMVRLADELGFGPNLNYTDDRSNFDLIGGEFIQGYPHSHMQYVQNAEPLARLIRSVRLPGEPLHVDREIRNRLIDWMLLYFKVHIENMRELKSHLILREVL